ncbi:MAG: hypothetical protein M3392_06925 [Actinomycetota bacterium]|jgi:hypothetical protein|nr:hypothetical protein [Actinomycetota bacterium]MDQ5812943.1 hypothetical protein [Actinomycetota bacterium]MDQ5818312.1 hypothetical protein [Actinomycetota bacterium]MDQ5829548.1 hypothetical protein [Actinomycetota bacterium]
MSDQTQKMLLTGLTVLMSVALNRPLKNMISEAVPERRGVRDDVTEAVLQGIARMAAVVAASLLVRWLASRMR